MKPKKRVKKETEEKKQEQEQKNTEKKQEQTQKKTEKKQEGEVKKKEKEVKKDQEVKKETIKKVEEKKPEIVPPKEVKPKPTAKPEAPPAAKPPTVEKVTKPPVVKPPPTITGGDKGVMDMVKKHEGVRTKPYKDSLGLWTVGVGHLIGDGKTLPEEWKNKELTMKEVDELFAKDFQKHKEMAMKGPGWDKANESGQAALIDLTFNMGAWWKKFKNAAKALDSGDFNKAADELQYKDPATKEPSLWYQQVKGRAVTIVDMIRNGKKTKDDIQNTNLMGQKIDSTSTENRELKKDMKDSAPAPVIVNNNSTTQTKKQTPMPAAGGDDRSAYAKKVN
jgi:lysozyme